MGSIKMPAAAENMDGYKELIDINGDSSTKGASSKLLGYALTTALGALSAATTLVTGFASKSGTLPLYTVNFARCFAASIPMVIWCKMSGVRIMYDLTTMKNLMWLGAAYWFFLWAYVESMAYLSVVQFSAANITMSSVFSIVLGSCLLGETATLAKAIGVLRNMLVVMLVMDPFGFFSEAGSDSNGAAGGSTSKLVGYLWVCIAVLGTIFMRVVQRTMGEVPSSVSSFWCCAINTVLWLPPGSIPPRIRVPFLWPATPEDHISFYDVSAFVWACTFVSGAMGAFFIAGQAMTLRFIDVGTHSTLIPTLTLAFGFFADVLSGSGPQPPRVMFGIFLAIVGVLIESLLAGAFARKSTGQVKG